MRRVSLLVCAVVFAAVPALAQGDTASGPLAPYMRLKGRVPPSTGRAQRR